jgi:cation:H+ antiporter
VTSIQAQRRGDTELLVGNLLGSNLFNSLTGGAIVPAWLLMHRGNRISRVEAGPLLIAYAATLPLIR